MGGAGGGAVRPSSCISQSACVGKPPCAVRSINAFACRTGGCAEGRREAHVRKGHVKGGERERASVERTCASACEIGRPVGRSSASLIAATF